MRRRAFHRVILPDGREYAPGVVLTDDDGNIVEIHQLQGEEPYTEWVGGSCVVPADA